MSTNKKDERKSNSKSTMMKRLLVLMMITMSLVFSGAQSTPTANAGAPCDMICTEFIDPNDGQCYVRCCPADEACKVRCFITPCK
jgi:hypothetical protein